MTPLLAATGGMIPCRSPLRVATGGFIGSCGNVVQIEPQRSGYHGPFENERYLAQAMREDEEVIILFKSFIEVINANRLY